LLFDKFRVSETRNFEEMMVGVMSRHPQFKRLDAQPGPYWKYTFNRIVIGSVRIGISYGSDIRYESLESADVTVTGCFSGRESLSRIGVTRQLLKLPSFAPMVPYTGEVKDACFYTVRLSPQKLIRFIAELEGALDLKSFLESNWLTALPTSPALWRFLRYTFEHIDAFGPPVPSEARALEDLIYANVARALLFENRCPSVAGNAIAFARCTEYIEENLAYDISVCDVAATAGLSLRSTQTLFRQMAETTISGFIRERRLLYARKLLSTPGMTESVIAASVASGFSHLSYFGQCYRARFGETPSMTLRNGPHPLTAR